MTQPPPFQGGQPSYPSQPEQPGYGAQQPPAGGFPPPGGPVPPGGPGFPPGNLPPAPKKSNTGLFIRLGIAAAIIIAIVIVATQTNVFSNQADPELGDTSNTNAAAVGSCTDDSTIADQINVVNCEDPNAVWKVTARSDDPEGTDATAEAAATTICAGTTAVTFLYQYDPTSKDLDWLICLEPADGSNTLSYGEIPQVGDCVSSSRNYIHALDCNTAEDASQEVVGSGTPDPSQTDAGTAAMDVCGDGDWTMYYIGPDQSTPPFEWVYCTRSL